MNHHDIDMNDFNGKKSALYNEKMEFINQSLITAQVLLSITPNYDQLHNLEFSNLSLSEKPLSAVDLIKIPQSSIFNQQKQLSVMDFACGTGLVTQRIVPNLQLGSTLIGVDVSESMLSIFKERFKQEIQKQQVQCYQYDLLNDNDNDKVEWLFKKKKFDIIYCTISYHHFNNLVHKANRKLVQFLNTNGYLIVMDFHNPDSELIIDTGDKDFSPPVHHHHRGPSMTTMRQSFERLSLSNVFITSFDVPKGYYLLPFIKNHCSNEVYKKACNGEFPSREVDTITGTTNTEYLVPVQMMLAIAQLK